jgi:SAM-dependent methyltransferase
MNFGSFMRAGAPERPDVDSPDWARFADHVARYVFAMEYAKGKRVLDAGTGPGYGAAMLKAAGAREVVAVDIDPESIAQAQKRYGERGIEFLVDDCHDLGRTGGSFDLICSFENVEHLPHPERFVTAAARALAPGGMLIISTPDRAATQPFVDGRPANPHHMHEWYRSEFLDLLKLGFGHCELRVQVKSSAVDRRRQAAAALVRHLKWSNPLWKLYGVARVLLTGSSYWEPIFDLAVPSPSDYPIVDPALAAFFGESWCHVVLCTEPASA